MNYLKKLFEPTDMTKGKPWKKIVIFTIPMLIGNIAQQLYNTVDSIVVGRYVGDNALAAVGSAGPILFLLIALFIGVGMGASIIVAQYLGAKEKEELSSAIGTCIWVTGIATLIVMALSVMIIRPLLSALNTPESIIDWCTSYLLILGIGSAGLAYYNILSGVLRGLGDAFSALIYLLVATVVNIILDLVFVVGFGMGVNGVALATVIAQWISAALCIWKLLHMTDIFTLNKTHFKFSKRHAYNIVRLGLPSGITQAIISMAMIVVQSLTNSFGEMFIAANVIVMRVDGFAMMPNFTFGTVMTTYAGQNVGAREYGRVEKGAKQGTLIAVGTSAFITILLLLFGRGLMGIFTNTPALADLSMSLMRILAAGYVIMAITQSLFGVLRGAGDTLTPMWISMLTTVGIRVPVAYGIAYFTRTEELVNGRQESVFISILISWSIGALLSIFFYKRGKWKEKGIKGLH